LHPQSGASLPRLSRVKKSFLGAGLVAKDCLLAMPVPCKIDLYF